MGRDVARVPLNLTGPRGLSHRQGVGANLVAALAHHFIANHEGTEMFHLPRRQFLGLAASVLPALSAPVRAQEVWPTKPISITVAYAGGGAIDGLIRFCTEQIKKRHPGMVFVIEYKPGAGGNIAAEALTRMKADDHQFLMTGSSTHAANVSLYKSLPFDPDKDFAPIASMATVPYILVVNPTRVPVTTFPEFVAHVKVRPGQLNYGSSAIAGRMAGEILKQRTALQVTFVPYKALPQVVADVVGGHLDFAFGDPLGYLPHVRSGRLRALAVTTRGRISVANDIPTLSELGVPDFDVSAWLALYGKAGTPVVAVQRFNRLINEALESPEGQAFITGIGLQPLLGTPEQLAAMQKRDTVAWAQVIRAAGIAPE